MVIFKTVEDVRNQVKEWKKQGLKVGLVPTMGYLHEGHGSLIERAAKENDKVVVSIFVNPTQFGENEDLSTYPRDLEGDIKVCEACGATAIFNPEVCEMYFDDKSTSINMTGLSEGLCGASRPVHFTGVCTVVGKLFNIVPADKAYFGEKDAQQLAIIKRMVRDLNFDIQIVGCPIVREKDGLAKSSRNVYLNEEERKAATILNKSLSKAKEVLDKGERNTSIVKNIITEIISSEKLAKIDYVEIVDAISMKEVKYVETTVLIALAVYVGKTRLIDNFTFELQ